MLGKTLTAALLLSATTCLPLGGLGAQVPAIHFPDWSIIDLLPDLLSTEPVPFQRGEANGDGLYDMADGVAILSFLFLDGHELPCLKAADANDDGEVGLDDAMHVLNFLYMGRQAPPPPFGRCGFDPTPDGLTCLEPSCETESGCPNPQAKEIRFDLVERFNQFNGRIRVTAVFENAGSQDFISSPGQQSVQLYEGSTLVAWRSFTRLDAGDTISVSFERDWWTSTEFEPNYSARISYDPDIYVDGNPRNDDCESGDNRIERHGREADALFR